VWTATGLSSGAALFVVVVVVDMLMMVMVSTLVCVGDTSW